MESACAELKLYTGMVWMDSELDLRARIKQAGDWGLMDKIRDDFPAHVVAGFKNVPEHYITWLYVKRNRLVLPS